MRRNAGEDAAPGNLFTDGDPETSTPASVVGSDFLNIMQEELASVIEGAGLTIDQSNAYAANDKTQLKQAIQVLGGGSGGGGGGAWYPYPGQAPSEDVENNEKVWLFESGAAQKLTLWVKVPSGYTAGRQINLYLGAYSPSTSGTFLLQSTSYLVRKNTDAMSATTNTRASTNSALTNTVANQYREVILDITSSIGVVGVAIAAGDMIRVELTRGTDTDTADVRFVPSSTEVKLV